MSCSAIQIAYTTNYQKKKVVNSGNVGKLNSGVIIIVYYVRLMVKQIKMLLRPNLQDISPNRVLQIAICIMLN